MLNKHSFLNYLCLHAPLYATWQGRFHIKLFVQNETWHKIFFSKEKRNYLKLQKLANFDSI